MGISLAPWMPGGVAESWLQLLEVVSPDTITDELEQAKALGLVIAAATYKTTIINLLPETQANILALLIGRSGSKKSWLGGLASSFLPRIIGGTPEKMAEILASKRNGIVYVPELETWAKNATRGGYMSEAGNFLDLLYYSEAQEYARRKRGASVYVEAGEYLVSAILNLNPDEADNVFSLWPGLRRRLLPVPLKTASPKYWRPEPIKESLIEEITSRIAKAKMTTVDLGDFADTMNKYGEELYVMVKMGTGDETLARGAFQYFPRAIANILADDVSGLMSKRETVRAEELPSHVARLARALGESEVVLVKPREGEDFKELLRQTKAMIAKLYLNIPDELVNSTKTDSLPKKITSVLENVGGAMYTRDLIRKLKVSKRHLMEAVDTLSEAEMIGVRMIKGRGRSRMLVYLPDRKICATCRLFMTDECPHFERDPNSFTCDRYTPV